MTFVSKSAGALHLALIRTFRGAICPVCGEPKEARQCFCKTCYFTLRPDMRTGLYTPIDAGQGEFEEYYLNAMAYLFRKHMHRKYAEWARPVLQSFVATGLITALTDKNFAWMKGA